MQIPLLFYAVNGLGLGHLTRLLAIARQLKKLNDNILPIFFTSSEGAHILYQEGFVYYKVPSKNLAKETGVRRKDLAMTYQQILLSLVSTYRPKAIVVDTFPTGSLNELTGILSLPSSMKKIFIHREQKPEKMPPNRILLQNFYDLIIAPHPENTAKIPVPNPKKLFWSGAITVRNQDELFDKKTALEKLKIPAEIIKKDTKIILLNLGGGGDETTKKNYEDILKIVLKNENWLIFIPHAPLEKFSLSINHPRVFQASYFPMVELFKAFDVAISATGYNTFHELMLAGIPSIFIPKNRGYDDQFSRAMSAEKQKSGFCIQESEIPKLLLEKINILLKNSDLYSKKSTHFVMENGAKNSAFQVLGLLI